MICAGAEAEKNTNDATWNPTAPLPRLLVLTSLHLV